MATTKRTIAKKEIEPVTVNAFTKEQLVKSKKYMSYMDFLNGNLLDGKKYTTEQVDELITKYYGKGKVK